MSYNMMIGYDFTIVLQWGISIASKHDFDDQFFLLAIVQRPTAAPVTVTNNDKNGGKKIESYDR
jgi:hypothetical protein